MKRAPLRRTSSSQQTGRWTARFNDACSSNQPVPPERLERVRLFPIQAGFPNGRNNAILFS